jgi:hypothetical protein
MLQLANRPSCRRVFDPVGMGFRPRNFMKNRMLAVGQAVSPANRPEGRLPSPLPRGFSPLSPPFSRFRRERLLRGARKPSSPLSY